MGDRPIEFWESLAERRIREAAEQGEFDDLPGHGQPLPGLSGSYDPGWWVREWLRRTNLDETAAELRRCIRSELPRLKAAPTAERTINRIAELNEAIAAVNRQLTEKDRIEPIRI